MASQASPVDPRPRGRVVLRGRMRGSQLQQQPDIWVHPGFRRPSAATRACFACARRGEDATSRPWGWVSWVAVPGGGCAR